MARRARMIVPGAPHHVTQRGNRWEPIFLEPGDEAIYLDLLSARLERHGVACWAYCLMPNHVHLILTPSDETGLARAVGEAHRRYTAFVGARALDGASVSVPVQLGGDGWGSSTGGLPLSGAQSGQGRGKLWTWRN